MSKVQGNRYAWSCLSGLLLAASFPKLGAAGLAWVAPGCLLFCAYGRPPGEQFRIGFVGGLTHYLASLYWLLLIPFPAGAFAGWLALGVYLALYPAFWVWLCWRSYPLRDSAGAGAGVELFLSVSVARRAAWALGCAVLWVAWEMIIARLFTGFPWNLLGVSQYRILPLIQITTVTGVYGISFLLVWFSVALAAATLSLVTRPAQPHSWLGDLLLPLIAALMTVAYGSTELAKTSPAGPSLKAVLVQPSIPQTLIWDTNQNAVRFSELLKLSERGLQHSSNAQMLVWPEAALPNMLRYDFDTYSAVTNLAMRHHVWIVLGSDDAVPRPGGQDREADFFNSSFLVSPEGKIAGVYRKRRLVIFGEYTPLERWLPFIKWVTPGGESFKSGDKPGVFVIPELQAKMSVLICFEDVFPHYAREDVSDDTDFLLNLTNNGWFGESAAQWQHAAIAVFRAVENRVPLVRCTNNGLTCWVDTAGALHDAYFPNTTDIYGAGFKTVDIPLLSNGSRRTLTFYNRYGDCFGWVCVVLATISGAWHLRRRCGSALPNLTPDSAVLGD